MVLQDEALRADALGRALCAKKGHLTTEHQLLRAGTHCSAAERSSRSQSIGMRSYVYNSYKVWLAYFVFNSLSLLTKR